MLDIFSRLPSWIVAWWLYSQ